MEHCINQRAQSFGDCECAHKNKHIFEVSPFDKYWGTAGDWPKFGQEVQSNSLDPLAKTADTLKEPSVTEQSTVSSKPSGNKTGKLVKAALMRKCP